MKNFVNQLNRIFQHSFRNRVYKTLKSSVLFNSQWYLNTYLDVNNAQIDPLTHFINNGANEMRDPSENFSTKFYLDTYPDVVQSGLNPLYHFLTIGIDEGRSTKPISDYELISTHFDKEYYFNRYEDLVAEKIEPIEHYLLYGWYEGRDPSPHFSTNGYLEANRDVKESGICPYVHYFRHGKKENRSPDPQPVVNITQDDYNLVKDYFDEDYYFKMNPDLIQGKIDPIEHYLLYGWKEDRNPSSGFSTKYYLEQNEDILNSNVNPLIHYILHGRKEKRRPKRGAINLKLDESSSVVKNIAIRSMIETSKPLSQILSSNEFDNDHLNIHWVIPDFNIGSGGHMTIFRMVNYLEYFGHQCTLWISNPSQHDEEEMVFEDINKHFKPIIAQVHLLKNLYLESEGDVLIATGWQTAHIVANSVGFKVKCYFVQDHEPEFFATGTYSLASKETYRLDFGCICASPWLESLMKKKYKRWASSFHLSHERNEYFPKKNWVSLQKESKVCRIAVYARNSTERRAVELVLAGLEYLRFLNCEFAVDFFGQDSLEFSSAPFSSCNHGVLSSSELRELYQNCQIGICFSSTNYSLVPQEMMACALPVVELDTCSTRAIFPNDVVTFSGPNPKDIAVKIESLLKDSDRRINQANKALEWVSSFTWEKSARLVEVGIKNYLQFKKFQAKKELAKSGVDVIIPTYNGGNLLKEVIESIQGQISKYSINIFCIDSSSTDGTNEWLKNQPNITLRTISKEHFQHGKTRNLGASMGEGKYIVFITQDALPCTKYWIHHLVGLLERYPDAAGVFGRHIAYSNHSAYARIEIDEHFNKFHQGPIAVSKNLALRNWGIPSLSHKNYLHYYSDNNSAMKRSIWMKIPYPEVDYGEDQLWAQRIIDAGLQKLYSHYGTVYHSHEFTEQEAYERCKIEGAFFKKHFGYVLGPHHTDQLEGRLQKMNEHTHYVGKKYNMTEREIAIQCKINRMKLKGWLEGHQEVMISVKV